MRLMGGALLIAIGILYCFRHPRRLKQDDGSPRPDYVTAFLLNLTNPTTALSFLAVLTALGLQHNKSWWQGWMLIAGIFAGAMAWWLLLAGVAIGGFGIATMAMSHAKPAGL